MSNETKRCKSCNTCDAIAKALETFVSAVGPLVSSWPNDWTADIRVGRTCYHVTIASHVQRPPKRGTKATDKCTMTETEKEQS